MGYSNETSLLMTQVIEKLQNDMRERVLTHPSSNIDVGQTGSFVAPSLTDLKGTMDLAKDVQSLSEVDQKIMELDQMTSKAQLGSPGETEARQWQELSLMTLQWSRKNLIEQRQACLRRIVDAASEQLANSVFTEPAETCEPAGTSEHGQGTSEPAGTRAPEGRENNQVMPAFRPPPGLENMQPEALQSPPGLWIANEQCQERVRLPSTTSEEEVEAENPLRKESGVPDLENNGGTLRIHLQSLQEEDSKNVLILRKINKLGFESPELLESYFSEFGDVKRVLVAHSHVKPSNRRSRSRVRPAGLGFVVMGSRADIDAVLCMGEQHLVNGIDIQVQSYEQRGKQEFSNLLEDEC